MLTIPIKVNSQIESIKNFEASTFSTGFSSSLMSWENDSIILEIQIRGYGFNKTDEQVEHEIKSGREWITNRLNY